MLILGSLLAHTATASPDDAGVWLSNGDCIPTASPEFEPDPHMESGAPAVDVSCDPSGAPCGVVQQPICWTFRFACYNAIQGAFNAYDYNARHLREFKGDHGWEAWSSCETQPADNNAVETSGVLALVVLVAAGQPTKAQAQDFEALSSDCLPSASTEGELGTVGPAIHLACDTSGAACGILQQPVCWTFRMACFVAVQPVLNVYDYNGRHIRHTFHEGQDREEDWQAWSSCETQPADNL